MAKKRRRAKSPPSGGSVRVKGHTRTPRGANAGKKAVRVKGYRRHLPR